MNFVFIKKGETRSNEEIHAGFERARSLSVTCNCFVVFCFLRIFSSIFFNSLNGFFFLSLHEIHFFIFWSCVDLYRMEATTRAHRRSCSSSSHHHSIEIQNKLNDCFFPSLQFFFFLLWRPWVVLMCFPGPTKFVFPLRRRKKKFPFCFCFIPYFFSKVKKSIESHRDAVRIVKVYHVVCSRWSVA